ncbi:MAG: hypothetical protein HYV07_27705 [Deltaproteobacteria bacterium]|nr:hypothetical protein [Deltaproteobacteria bacterium]
MIEKDDLTLWRRRLAALTSAAARRIETDVLARSIPSGFGVSRPDVGTLLEVAAVVARNSDDDELLAFLQRGQLPEMVQLSPRQMESVRGGLLTLTATRGIVPAALLGHWPKDPHAAD